MARYGSIAKPLYILFRQPPKFSKVDKKAILELLLQEGWRQQVKIIYWLAYKYGVYIIQLAVSRILKSEGWT